MAQPNQLTLHIETFVDVTRSLTQQAESLKAIAHSLDNGSLSLNELVIEMDMYLTTTDNVVRARGILLLAEILNCLKSKPLESAVVHSLIAFFTERLEDWRALRGALVGCLALMRRKDVAGVVTAVDAEAVAKSFIENMSVQSFALHERKLSFELLECLLQQYPGALMNMGDILVYATIEAIDGEKDPQCLLVAFHTIELLAQLFPSSSGPVASSASDLFEAIGCYFPLHFTHKKDDEVGVKIEDLSRALMLAISSTPFFEPYAIPLLLEKLSSSLPVAKVDSLKCLEDCAIKYGVSRMKKHYGGLWPAIKDAFISSTGSHLSFTLETLTSPMIELDEIHKGAVNLLQRLIKQDISFLSFVVEDIYINTVFDTISRHSQYKDMPDTNKLEILIISQILSVSAKASPQSCDIIFATFFVRLMNILGISEKATSGNLVNNENSTVSIRLYHGGLYLCIELLSASKDPILGSEKSSSTPGCLQQSWCSLVRSFSDSLIRVFTSAVCSSIDCVEDGYLGVKGLLTMGTFWGDTTPVSTSEFEKILTTLTSIITAKSDKTLLWELALKALVCIGSFINQYHEQAKAMSYMKIVVENLVSVACSSHCGLSYPMILEATSEVCSTGPEYVEKMVQGFEEALCSSLSEFYVSGNLKSIEIGSQLLECFTNKLLPRVAEIDGLEKILVHFAMSMWNQIDTSAVGCDFYGREFVEAAMATMRQIVGVASVDSQNIIIQKGYSVISSSKLLAMEVVPLTLVALEGLQCDLSPRDELILSLFASVIIAASPSASIPDVKSLIQLFSVSLLKGYIPPAHALGSMVNKLGSGSGGTNVLSDCSFEEVCDIIFHKAFASGKKISSDGSGGSEKNLSQLCLGSCGSVDLQTRAITGVAWIGKGLLMRGDKRVNEAALILVECLKSTNCPGKAMHPSAIKHAADAFSIIMSDSEVCLNRKLHAVIRPLYKQRVFSITVPILESLIINSQSPLSRTMFLVALAHIISNVPVTVILDNTKKLQPIILEGLSVLSHDSVDKETLFSLLLVLSGTLTDIKGKESSSDNAHKIMECLVKLTSYPYLMVVRETAVQCLVALLELPRGRIYPLRREVLQAVSKALDDPKRRVRQEAIKCRQAWASITSSTTSDPF